VGNAGICKVHISSISTTKTKIETEHGEVIYELIGRTMGFPTTSHSLAHVVIPPGKSSLRHYHPSADESYCVARGEGRIEIDDESAILSSGDAVIIPAGRAHKIYSVGNDDLVFLVVCVPAWEPSNTVWLERA
jgi:mannose-6-phosphate isomerase-like protein (cupin superfamily)